MSEKKKNCESRDEFISTIKWIINVEIYIFMVFYRIVQVKDFKLSHVICIFISHKTVGCHVYAAAVMQMQKYTIKEDSNSHKYHFLNNGKLIWISHTGLFYQWRCIWHLSEPSQSLRSSHSEQLLGLSLGLLGWTHRWRPNSCCAGSVGATQRIAYTLYLKRILFFTVSGLKLLY